MKKNIFWILSGILVLIIIRNIFVLLIQPDLPGRKVAELKNEIVKENQKVTYNSNPPTSGSHYKIAAREGVYFSVGPAGGMSYNTTQDDRSLVAAMADGFVILWYKCDIVGPSMVKEGATTQSSLKDKECVKRSDNLAKSFLGKGQNKLIVMPRVGLNKNYALTAWGRIDEFDEFDKMRVDEFIDAFRGFGPNVAN